MSVNNYKVIKDTCINCKHCQTWVGPKSTQDCFLKCAISKEIIVARGRCDLWEIELKE